MGTFALAAVALCCASASSNQIASYAESYDCDSSDRASDCTSEGRDIILG